MNMTDLKKIMSREIIPGYKAKFIHTENLTLAYWEIKAGSVMPVHSHPNEQVVNMIEGEFELTVKDRTHVLKPEMVVTIQPNIEHSGIARTDCRIIDVFFPCRDDYKLR